MNRTLTLAFLAVAATGFVLVASPKAKAQVATSIPFVKLQTTTPGSAQSGNSNISGTSIASLFSGSGAGLTGIPWSAITGAPSGLPPTGPAGGDLAGTYPNPVIAASAVTNGKLANDAASLAKVSGGAMFSNGGFVGIGDSNSIGSANFVVSQNTTAFGGMYMNTAASGKPFYGYAQGGSFKAFQYLDGSDNNTWKFYTGGADQMSMTTAGDMGLGTMNPDAKLQVKSAGGSITVHVQQGGPSGASDDFTQTIWADTDSGDAVFATSSKLNAFGVFGMNSATGGTGVRGVATKGTGVNYGVYGESWSTTGFAGYFNGKVQVTGLLSKGGGSFKIDHPLDPEHKYLYHSFVESPDMKNIYDGVVNTDAKGYATVTMPDYFQALNQDFRYQLTVIDEGDSATFVQTKVVRGINGNKFTLRSSVPNVKVSWQVTGVRHDAFANAHRIQVEENKSPEESGLYLHPTEAGMPKERGIDYQNTIKRGQGRNVVGRP